MGDTSIGSLFMNELRVVHITLTDLYEGAVTFEASTGNRFSAFFRGEHFVIGQTYRITFDGLEHPSAWEVIFSENKACDKKLEAAREAWSYLAYGQILAINPVTLDCGDIVMAIGDWTNVERVVGEFIGWKIDRLDVVKFEILP